MNTLNSKQVFSYLVNGRLQIFVPGFLGQIDHIVTVYTKSLLCLFTYLNFLVECKLEKKKKKKKIYASK